MILPFLIAWLASRISRHQDHVIQYLREENRILKAKLKGKRIALTDTERRRLAVLAHAIDGKDLKDLSTIATPDTLRRWYRRLVDQAPGLKLHGKPLGRPRVATEIEHLVIGMATENPRWGYRRIQGALSNLGYYIHNTTVRNVLRRNHIDPAPIRGKAGMSWSQFVKLHLEVLVASGFFEARLSPCAHLWAAVTQLGRIVCARSVQRLIFIRHGPRSAPVLLTRQSHALGARRFTYFDIRFRLVLGRRRRVPHKACPTVRLLSSQPIALQVSSSPMQQERSPPGRNAGGFTIVMRRPVLGRRVSTLRLVLESRGVEGERHRMLSQYPRANSGANPYQVAA